MLERRVSTPCPFPGSYEKLQIATVPMCKSWWPSAPPLTFDACLAGVIWAQRDPGAFPPYKGVVGEDSIPGPQNFYVVQCMIVQILHDASHILMIL